MIDFLSGSDAALFGFDGRQGMYAVRAFRKDTGLIFPEGTVKPTGAALRADAVLPTVIVILVRRFLHQKVKRHRAICRVHFYQPPISENRESPVIVLLCAVQ